MTGSSPHASKNASPVAAGRTRGSAGGWPRRRARRRCRRRRPGPGSTGAVAPGPVLAALRIRVNSSSVEAPARYRALMPSTTAGSASVVVSPSAWSSATSRSRRRMILPERVFGRSSVKRIDFGFAIGPIVWPTWSRSSSTSSSLGSLPPRRITNAAIAWPVVVVVRADDRGLGDRGVVDERVLDLGGRDVVARDEHDVVDAAEQPEVAVVVALGAVAREVASRRSGSSTCRGSAPGRPRCRAASTATAG